MVLKNFLPQDCDFRGKLEPDLGSVVGDLTDGDLADALFPLEQINATVAFDGESEHGESFLVAVVGAYSWNV